MTGAAVASPPAVASVDVGPEFHPLNVPSSVQFRITPDDFWDLCGANGDMRLERTAEGVLVVMSPASSGSGRRNASLTAQVVVWSEAEGGGVAFDSSAGFTLPNGAVRAPDVSWMTRARWEAVDPELRDRFAPVCPDFVAELTSPSDTRAAARVKMVEYLEQGTRLGWLIDPKSGEVDVYRPGRAVETLVRPETLSGEDVLPGLVVRIEAVLARQV